MDQTVNKHVTSSPYSLSFASPSNEGDGGGVSQSKQKAFTLVELIVVVTILAILATIGFVSYSSYLTGVRDTNRLAQLVSIHDGLELYRTSKDLPLPDASVDVVIGTETIATQGYAGSNVLETIDFTKGGVDPRDGEYFSYYLTDDRKYFQLMAFLEEETNVTAQTIPSPGRGGLGRGILNQTQAVDYSSRIPTIYGKKLGILTDTLNTPIQEISDIITDGELVLTNTLVGYVGHLTDIESITEGSLLSINPKASCRRIKRLNGGSDDGVYKINPTGSDEFDVYCDMTTDGGGWTASTVLADTTTLNLFDTGNTEKITSITENISSKGIVSDIWQDDQDKDIMLICSTNNSDVEAYEIPFIIYDFQKNDIGNLEKLSKQNTILSSGTLQGKWDNKNIEIESTWGISTDSDNSHTFKVDGKIAFSVYKGNSIFARSDFSEFGPGYNADFIFPSSAITIFDQNNYCFAYLR